MLVSSIHNTSLLYSMRYVAAYLLASLGGNTQPSADDVKKILSSVGVEAEDDKLNMVRHSYF